MHTKRKTWLWCAAVAALLLALCSKSSPLYALNDWMDANIFYTMGKAMANGLVLYRDAFDHKGPLLYLVYAGGYFFDKTGFTGVLLLEIAALTVTLYYGLATVQRLRGSALHPAWCVLPGFAITAARAFSHGGSAEEFCLPLLAVALWALVNTLLDNTPMPLWQVVLQGVLAGCALWLKYTVLGFYLGWVAVLAAVYLHRRRGRLLAQSAAAYLGGMALATLPWVVYFAANGAVGDWLTAYFYDNLALYAPGTGGNPLFHLVQCCWWALRDNLLAAALLVLGLAGLLARRQHAVAAAVAVLGLGLAATSFTGSYLVYYGLVLAVFAALGLTALPAKPPALPGAAVRLAPALALLAIPAALLVCPNAPLLGRSAESLPQYRFAAQMPPGASLLNYGTLDGGFYTTSGALPPCRYFCVTNMPLPDQWNEQRALLADTAVDYIVSPDSGLAEQYPAYALADAATYNGGEGEITWYFYRRA